MNWRRTLIWLAILTIPAIGMVLATEIAASTWERVRTKPEKRWIRVTGSAKQRIVSDLISWTAEIRTEDPDRTECYRALKRHVDTALQYLREQGVDPGELRVSAVSSSERSRRETVGTGIERIQRTVSIGWSTSQEIAIRSSDIPTVERVSREITQLLEQGVPISSSSPQYFYTRLGEVKIDMLARASADAHTRASKIVESAGGAGLGKLIDADMGVININPANSTATSWEGNNDTSSLEKDILTIVHLSFELP